MARILAVGVATLDIILTVDSYPPEDAKIRARGEHVCRGGNATNTLVVLSQLGHRCSWAGVITRDPDGQQVMRDLVAHDIDTAACRTLEGARMPTSYVLASRESGTRTIVHWRNLPEYDFATFEGLRLESYDWIHFEGRDVDNTVRMVEHVRQAVPRAGCSIEIEKHRRGIERLFGMGDVLMFSGDYARRQGFTEANAFLTRMREQAPRARVSCAWGEDGAYGAAPGGELVHAPAFTPGSIVDTRGAGDTFNAGLIDALVRGHAWQESLHRACRLAGYKCGLPGLELGLDADPDSDPVAALARGDGTV